MTFKGFFGFLSDIMDNYQPQIIWKGNLIGVFDSPRPDMTYLEGLWLTNETKSAAIFAAIAKQLDLQEVFHNLDKGVDIILQDEKGKTRAVVISLSDENELFIRRIIS